MSTWVQCGVVFGMAGLAACGSVRPPAGGDDANGGGVDGTPGDGSVIDAPPGQAASCVGLPATCGADGHDNCCNSPDVFGGTYYRSFDRANDSLSGTTSSPATLSDFRLDKYEVTVGRFRAFVNAAMGTQSNPPLSRSGAHANILASGWDSSWNVSLPATPSALLAALKCDSTVQTWTDAPGANENRPMNCLSWFEAMAFCAWDGGYLPTEAEWNYAAAGGEEQRAFPWSVPAASLTVDLQHASYNVDGTADAPVLPVGSLPAGDGRWGQSDLAGNVAEWTLDWNGAYLTTCTDCASLAPTAAREIRGGGFGNGKAFLRSGFRLGSAPSAVSPLAGVRCARPASAAK